MRRFAVPFNHRYDMYSLEDDFIEDFKKKSFELIRSHIKKSGIHQIIFMAIIEGDLNKAWPYRWQERNGPGGIRIHKAKFAANIGTTKSKLDDALVSLAGMKLIELVHDPIMGYICIKTNIARFEQLENEPGKKNDLTDHIARVYYLNSPAGRRLTATSLQEEMLILLPIVTRSGINFSIEDMRFLLERAEREKQRVLDAITMARDSVAVEEPGNIRRYATWALKNLKALEKFTSNREVMMLSRAKECIKKIHKEFSPEMTCVSFTSDGYVKFQLEKETISIKLSGQEFEQKLKSVRDVVMEQEHKNRRGGLRPVSLPDSLSSIELRDALIAPISPNQDCMQE